MENTESMVILIDEVSKMAQLSKSRINNLLSEKKFIRPISVAGGKRRWLRSDVVHWLESQSTITSQSLTFTTQKRRNAKTHAERQESTDRALEKYRTKKFKHEQ